MQNMNFFSMLCNETQRARLACKVAPDTPDILLFFLWAQKYFSSINLFRTEMKAAFQIMFAVFAISCAEEVAKHSMHTEKVAQLDLVLSAGGLHTCFLNSSRILCWCDSEVGDCEPPAGYFRGLSCGSWHTCAISATSKVNCFGSGYALKTAPPSEPVLSLSSGFASTCAILSLNSSIFCWGFGVDRAQIPPGRFLSVSVGTRSACAIREEDSALICWGADEFGQVSKRPSGAHTAVSCGGGHCCAVTSQGRAVCWGGSDNYALGRPAPRLQERILQVTAGEDHACALAEGGSAVCWGKCGNGACDPPGGDGSELHRYAVLAAGGAHTCGALLDQAGIQCWGAVPGRPPAGPALLPAGAEAGSISMAISGGAGGAGQQLGDLASAVTEHKKEL